MVGPCMHVLCKVFYENIYHIFVKIVTVHSKQWMGQIGCLWPYKKSVAAIQIHCVYTANVLTIKIMDFDHVPNPGIMSP